MSALRGLIDRMKDVRGTFYARHRDRWRDLARRTTRTTLMTLRPPTAKPEIWQATVDSAVERISITLLRVEEAGVVISVVERPPVLPADDPKFVSYLTIDEVERWVAAGRSKGSKDEPGKNLDARDDGENNRQIAWKILTAMRYEKKGSDGLRRAIAEFLGAEATESIAELHDALLAAWLDVFAVQVAADWREWVQAGVKLANRRR